MAGQESNPVSRMVNVPLKELLEVIQGQQRGQQQEALQNQIKQQEKRMEKIEEMLQQLVQQVGNSAVLGRSPLMTTSVSKNATSEQSEQARDTSNLEVQTRWKRAWKFIVWKITERGEMWDDDLFNIDEEAEDIILERLTSLKKVVEETKLQNLSFDVALDRIPVVYPVDRWNDGQTSGIKSIMNVTLPNWPELYTVERPFGGKPAIVTSPIWTGFLKNLFKHIWPEAQDKHLYAALKRIAKGYTKPANPALDEMIGKLARNSIAKQEKVEQEYIEVTSKTSKQGSKESSNETTTVTRTSPSKERKTTSIPGTEDDTKKSKRTYAITKKASKKTKAADDDYDSEDAISVDTSTDVEHTVETPKKKQKGNDGHPKHVHMPEDTGEVDPPSRSKDLLNIVQAAEKTATEEKKKEKESKECTKCNGRIDGEAIHCSNPAHQEYSKSNDFHADCMSSADKRWCCVCTKEGPGGDLSIREQREERISKKNVEKKKEQLHKSNVKTLLPRAKQILGFQQWKRGLKGTEPTKQELVDFIAEKEKQKVLLN